MPAPASPLVSIGRSTSDIILGTRNTNIADGHLCLATSYRSNVTISGFGQWSRVAPLAASTSKPAAPPITCIAGDQHSALCDAGANHHSARQMALFDQGYGHDIRALQSDRARCHTVRRGSFPISAITDLGSRFGIVFLQTLPIAQRGNHEFGQGTSRRGLNVETFSRSADDSRTPGQSHRARSQHRKSQHEAPPRPASFRQRRAA